ncbi:hypothetical protein [Methanosphaerula subterraneus]
MDCFNNNSHHTKKRSARWTRFEIGSVILYGVAIGVSIIVALMDMQIEF